MTNSLFHGIHLNDGKVSGWMNYSLGCNQEAVSVQGTVNAFIFKSLNGPVTNIFGLENAFVMVNHFTSMFILEIIVS